MMSSSETIHPWQTPSPFLSGTKLQLAWDSTSMGWFKECPRKYQYHMLDQWSGRGESIHLRWGILYHEALDLYEKARHGACSHDDAVKGVVDYLLKATWDDGVPWRAAKDLPSDDRTSVKSRENLVRTVVWYLEKFGERDPARTKISSATGAPMVELHFQFELGYGKSLQAPYSLCGYLDRVVDFQGQAFVMDRKTTTSTLGSYYFEQYEPDNQMSFYTLAAEVAFKTPVKGVIVDAAQIAVGFSRFVRSFVFKTHEQIEEWMKDLKIYLRQAEAYAEANYWPMNDKSCHKYGGCVFREICSKSPGVRDRFLESAFEKKEWNPLIPR